VTGKVPLWESSQHACVGASVTPCSGAAEVSWWASKGGTQAGLEGLL